MDAATIITNIKSQALVGNTGAVDDNDRILRYLNKGYSLVYARIAQLHPGLYQRFQNIPITDGSGLFIFPVLTILSIKDRNNGFRILTPRGTSDVELTDPGFTATGAPATYDQLFNGLMTYPLNDTVLQIRYVPPPVPLTADTREIDIQVPPQFHEVLEWAALFTIAYDERDKLVGTELAFTQAAFDKRMESLSLYILAQRPAEERRVKQW